MAQLSWNEIQKRALEFSAKWEGETYEKGESQSFWSDFLATFGIDRRRHGAYFEYAVKKIDNRQGFIDMFWPGILLAEQKSAGRDLSAANTQAFNYLYNLSDEELPQFIIVSDFANFELINLETRERTTFKLTDLHKKVKLFGFLIGRYSTSLQEEDPVNRKAAETMADLHNTLYNSNYKGHALELLLVRLVFCLFADDAGIFERGAFQQYIETRTSIDGTNLGPILAKIFEVLDTPVENRQNNLDNDLASLPYVNGGLFAEITRMPDFSSSMRDQLLVASRLDWSLVSPAIFGSMFQGVMSEKARRDLGAHYTSERNILKVIKGLFLDQLYAEFHLIKNDRNKLNDFHQKIANLTFLDPACGCGNFLVITYRELRKLEHQVLSAIHGKQALLTSIIDNIKVNVDQMNGIEIEEFPALIAETALWLTDHQMNLAASQQFGKHYVRLPLKAKANIRNVDALELDWNSVIDAEELDYILGNPPFSGSKYMNDVQRAQVAAELDEIKGSGTLDYVAAWYAKSAKYMIRNREIQAALVSTNSIAQGEQVGILWPWLLKKGIHINFAHQTFKWKNEGKNNAAVYCIIVGFSYSVSKNKLLYIYEKIDGEPIEITAKNINPYLTDAPDVVVTSRSKPICPSPSIGIGNKPVDGGNLLFTDIEKNQFISIEPLAEKCLKKWIGSDEFINRYYRWVLWVNDLSPEEIRKMPHVLERIDAVRRFRLDSKSKPTQKIASLPTHFHVENIPTDDYLVIPKTSSEKRAYIPIGYVTPDVFAGDAVFIVQNSSKYDFGILTSRMHMAWVRRVCGRLKSDYRYSKDIVYNNFIWPSKVTDDQTETVNGLVDEILRIREHYPQSSYADLYDFRTMPRDLHNAHANLDKKIDSLYRAEPFIDDRERVEFLFKQYVKLIKTKKVTR